MHFLARLRPLLPVLGPLGGVHQLVTVALKHPWGREPEATYNEALRKIRIYMANRLCNFKESELWLDVHRQNSTFLFQCDYKKGCEEGSFLRTVILPIILQASSME